MAWYDVFRRRRVDQISTVPAQLVPSVPAPVQRMDSIVNALTGLGNPETDRGSSARPEARLPLNDGELKWLVNQHAIPRRIVWLPARDALRQGFHVFVRGTKRQIVESEIRTMKLRQVLLNGVGRGRWYGGCVTVVLTDDVPTLEAARAPMSPGSRIKNLLVLGKQEATAYSWSTDLSDPNFGRPEYWQVTPTGSASTFVIHHSRVMYFQGDPMDPEDYRSGHGYHLSVLESAWDQVRRHDQIASAGALISQDLRQASIKIEGLSKLATEDQASLISLRMMTLNRTRGMLGVMLMDQEDEYASHDQGVNGYGELHDRAQFDLSAATGIPQTILFGQAPSGLTTDDESARRNYHGVCNDIRIDKCEEHIVRFASLLTGIPVDDILVKWPALDMPSAVEQAEIELKHAQADQLRIDSQVVSVTHVTRSRFSPIGYQQQLDPVDEADIIDVKPGEMPTPQETMQVLAGGKDPRQTNGSSR